MDPETNRCIDLVLDSLRKLRISPVTEEFELQDKIAEALKQSNISFIKEYRIAPKNRIDFLVEGGIGIEVKKGKPNRYQTTRQLERYTSFEEIHAIIVVVERNLNIPDEINGKKCISFGLNRLWGVAL